MRSFSRWFWTVACGVALVPSMASRYSETYQVVNDTNGCTTMLRTFNPLIHKPKYRVGVFSSEGDDVAYRQYNLTFAQYLTATAGRRFNPPIHFEMVPVTLTSLMEMGKEEEVDFSFASSAVSSCMATEQKVQPLVTVINRRQSRGHTYELDQYGGVIATLATNKHINNMEDLKDKTIGAGTITAMGGGQTQFHEMSLYGLSFVADPKQMVFTNDERLTVPGLLNGDFEVAFVRTDQIERHRDSNGKIVDQDLFKIINAQTHVQQDGTLFPFVSSTSLHPEWPVAAFDHVSSDVSQEVQKALLSLRDHKESVELGSNTICETTPEIAQLALQASTAGFYAGFRTARSYFSVRTKQERAGLLRKDEDEMLRCVRGDNLYDDVDCPAGYFKLPFEDFHRSCDLMEMECKDGYTCYCKPCVAAFERVFQFDTADPLSLNATGCAQGTFCGTIEQKKEIHMRVIDNVKRNNPKVAARLHIETTTIELDVFEVQGLDWTYDIHGKIDIVGLGLMEIYFDGEQIPNSPVRIQVLERQCGLEYPGEHRVAAADGSCVCDERTVNISGECVETKVFIVVGTIGGFLIIVLLGYIVMRHNNLKNDAMWHVDVDELHFDDPPEVIGHGSFGVVLLAEYRGTKVAIKQAVKAKNKTGSSRKSLKQSTSQPGWQATKSDPGSVQSNSIDLEVGDSSEGTPKTSDTQPNFDPTTSKESSVGRESSGKESKESAGQGFNFSFLTDEYGKPNKKKRCTFWKKKEDHHLRFNQAILGQSASSRSSGSFARRLLCPWFNEKAQFQAEFVREMRVLSRLRHPCITTVMGAVISHCAVPMLVMEHMQNGSLDDLLRNGSMFFGGEIILQILRDVAQGLRYLHTSKPPILHGDMKAKNILIDSRFRAKLADFGLSNKQTSCISGSPFWLPPEYLLGKSPYDTTCDMYSVGIIMYEIYSRKSPYAGEDFREVLRKVCNRRINKRPDIPDTCPPKMVDLMKKCWNKFPSHRPLASDLDLMLMEITARDCQPRAVQHEAATSSLSLDELFPRHVSKALKAGEKVEPESHELVTVVFSDIIHFTDISRELSPLKVSQMLDRLYLAFDKIAKKHYVFKVETIGDAYMGVTNLEGNQDENHVKHIAEFAVDMIAAANNILIDEEEPSKGYINIRVGFHSGPVVSNVIGSLNPRYGLFGDTVNTASRMESNSKANRILCSERAYNLLRQQAPNMPIKKQGKVFVKGKGDMNVYWVGDKLINADKHQRELERKHVGFVLANDLFSQSQERTDHQDEDMEQLRERMESAGRLPRTTKNASGKLPPTADKTTGEVPPTHLVF